MLSSLKLLRIGLLVLLAVLLPVRGAMAATMLCSPAGGVANGDTSATVHGGAHHDIGSTLGEPDQSHDHAAHDHGDGAHDHGGHDKCNVCTSSCSSPPLPSAAVGIEDPEELTSFSFPDLSAPAPTFQSDGQERPPRTT